RPCVPHRTDRKHQTMIASILRRRALSICTVGAALGFAASPIGCGSSEGPSGVSGKGRAIDHSSQSIGSLQWIDGTYAACLGHTDGDAWSLSISGATAMTNPTLGVAMRDPTCQLTVTGLMADTLYESSPTI